MDPALPTAIEPLASMGAGEAVVAFLTLAALEVVLGIDNVVFLSILVGKLPPELRARARRIGLSLALVLRILLLLGIGWVMRLTEPLFAIPRFWTAVGGDAHGVSGRDLILLAGGLFLMGKATWEIHDKLEGAEEAGGAPRAWGSFAAIVLQIALIDLVFSLDSVITAVGMVTVDPKNPWLGTGIMIAAVVVAIIMMLLTAGKVSVFVERHPTFKMLALSFLILIGVMLVAEGLHGHIPRGYIYFAMAFSLGVEVLNLRLRARSQPVHLHSTPRLEPTDPQ